MAEKKERIVDSVESLEKALKELFNNFFSYIYSDKEGVSESFVLHVFPP